MQEYQALIERECKWNEETGEYDLRCVAYTGNNMRKVNDDEDDQEFKISRPFIFYYYICIKHLFG